MNAVMYRVKIAVLQEGFTSPDKLSFCDKRKWNWRSYKRRVKLVAQRLVLWSHEQEVVSSNPAATYHSKSVSVSAHSLMYWMETIVTHNCAIKCSENPIPLHLWTLNVYSLLKTCSFKSRTVIFGNLSKAGIRKYANCSLTVEFG